MPNSTELLTAGSRIAVFLPLSLRAEIDALAQAADRPLTREVRAALVEYVERRRPLDAVNDETPGATEGSPTAPTTTARARRDAVSTA